MALREVRVLLQRCDNGKRPWCPKQLAMEAGLFGDENFEPRRIFPTDEEDEELVGVPLSEPQADSGSEYDEGSITLEEMAEFIEEEYDIPEQLEDPDDTKEYNWTADFTTFNGAREEFRETQGPKIKGTCPMDLFSQMWDRTLIEHIVKETNAYAWETIGLAYEAKTDISAQSKLHKWVDTSVSEIYQFISVLMLMGMCIRGRISEYWTTGIMGMPEFRRMMSKDRFLLLMRFLHFTSNSSITSHGSERKIAKIQYVIDYLNTKFKICYAPRRELTIDESLLLWKGGLSWVRCIRSKAARYGIKTYELCESVTGYVLNMSIYTGKGISTLTPLHGFTSVTSKIVLDLVNYYLGKGYTLFMDNFYNSVALSKYLKSRKTDVVGTLNRSRLGTPLDVKAINERKLPRGTVVGRHCGDISVLAWKDIKLVTMVSTFHTADMASIKYGNQNFIKPVVVNDYKRFMGGVDLKDQKLSMYLLERKRSVKWHIKVFRHLLNISVLNAYIIYCSNMGQKRKMSHRQFRYELATQLCPQQRSARQALRPCDLTAPDPVGVLQCHYPEQVPVYDRKSSSSDRFQRRRCVQCTAKKERKFTSVFCRQCNVFLCLGICWRDQHDSLLLE